MVPNKYADFNELVLPSKANLESFAVTLTKVVESG